MLFFITDIVHRRSNDSYQVLLDENEILPAANII